MTKFDKIINDKENRLKFISIILLLLFFVIFIKIIFTYIAGDEKHTEQLQNNVFGGDFKKYDILDVNGELLATTIRSYNFYISPKKTVFPEQTIQKILEIFPSIKLSDETIKKIKSKHKRLILIKKEITNDEKNKIIEIGIEAAEFEKTYSRIYPYSHIFSHIVGYVNGSLEGVYGIERSFNEALLHDNIQTSLDARVQSVVHFKLVDIIKEYQAKSAFGIVINMNNSQVISSVSLPDFNPHKIINPNGENMKNTAISEVYNLGSVFKILTIAMGLEYKLTETDKFNIEKPFKVDKSLTLKPHKSKKSLTMSEILAFSSNIGTAKILEKVGLEEQKLFLQKVNVFRAPKLELSPYELAPPLYKANKWSRSMHYTASYGYGISMSPLHLANIMKNILGKGNNENLTLLISSKKPQETKEKIVNNTTTTAIQKMLKDVINIGTAKRISNQNGYEICGKTSTTYKYDRATKEWSNKKKMVAFISIFPCDNPQYLIYFGADEPKPKDGKSYYLIQGGSIIAPKVAETISEIAPVLNIKPDLLNK